MSENSRPLDNRIEIITPENIAFEHRVAGPFRRLAAYLIDLLVRLAMFAVAVLALSLAFGSIGLGGMVAGMVLTFIFVLDWLYGGLFEAYWNGQTPGKHLMRLRVISITGQPISGWQAVLRNILRSIDAAPVLTMVPDMIYVPFYQIGLAAMSTNDRFQRLGDLASGTMVVVEQRQQLHDVIRVDEPEAIRLAGLLPANLRVSRYLAQALSAYVHRRKGFTPARRHEIARHVGEPLRAKYNLPPDTSYDLLLCALYHLAFVASGPIEDQPPIQNPFLVAPQTPGAQTGEVPVQAVVVPEVDTSR